MPLVPAKCPSCGGDMQIDNSRKEAFCPYCGSKFLVESAVNYYNTKNEYHIEHADIKMEDSNGLETRVKNAEASLDVLKHYSEAKKAFEDITKEFPSDWRGWWGYVRAETQNFTTLPVRGQPIGATTDGVVEDLAKKLREAYDSVARNVDAALRTADGEKRAELAAIWADYTARFERAVQAYCKICGEQMGIVARLADIGEERNKANWELRKAGLLRKGALKKELAALEEEDTALRKKLVPGVDTMDKAWINKRYLFDSVRALGGYNPGDTVYSYSYKHALQLKDDYYE